MTLPNELPPVPGPPSEGRPGLCALLASFLRAGWRGEARRGSPAPQPAPVQFERMGFWLAAPNVLQPSGVPMIGFTLHNGSAQRLSCVEADARLYLEGRRSPAASGLVRLRFDRTDGLAPGARFSGIVTMFMLHGDEWASARVRDALERRVDLRFRTAYGPDGRPIAGC